MEGLVFPVTDRDESTGEEVRSTQAAGKAILSAAVRTVDVEAADRIQAERNWRFRYHKHFVRMVEISAESPDAALAVARGGLDYMYEHFDFLRGGHRYSLREAMDALTSGSFATGRVEGRQPRPARFGLEIPYQGARLRGDALLRQLDVWVRKGTLELSAGAAIALVAQSPPWLDLSDRTFVLLGAGSAMGPLAVLLSLGAHVIAVGRRNASTWARLFATARDSCGTLTFPLPTGTDARALSDAALCDLAGAELCTQLPEVRNWLLEVTGREEPLCVGSYAYVPGESFPRTSLAMDAIVSCLVERRRAAVAYLGTPTDCHLVPYAAHAAATEQHRCAPWWQGLMALLSRGRWCARNARKLTSTTGDTFYFCDAYIVAQGPNYALAKRLQHWRAMVAREDGGVVVSSNIAPSTATASVTQNRMFARAYDSLPLWAPYEVPTPETSSAAMAALLIHDLRAPMHAGAPERPLANPQLLFADGAFHGGTWRCAHSFASIATPAVLLFFWRRWVLRHWLLLYNGLQALGWLVVLWRVVGATGAHLHHRTALTAAAEGAADAAVAAVGSASSPLPWAVIGWPLVWFQYAALLEVVHAMCGAVRTAWLPTLAQVGSRVAVVAIADRIPALHASSAILVFGGAWGATEVVRYSWYALNLLQGGKPAKVHTWLRYSTFLLLYPVGVAGELLLYRDALPVLDRTPALFTITAGALARWLVLPAYLPGLPCMYMYMLSQRRKALASLSTRSSARDLLGVHGKHM